MKSKTTARGRKTNLELREASIQQIRKSALKLFVTRGYFATTMEQIAAGAKLTKGGVYFYVPKKESLLMDILESIEHSYFAAAFDAIQKLDVSFKEKIVRLLHWQVTYALKSPQHIMLLVMMSVELSGKSDEPAKRIEEIYRNLHTFVQRTIQAGKEAGEIKTRLPPREMASFYIAAHDGMMLEWYRRQRDISGESLVRVFRELFIGGLDAYQ